MSRARLALLLLVAACGAHTPRPAHPAPPAHESRAHIGDPLAVLPTDTLVVVRLDAAALRRSPYDGNAVALARAIAPRIMMNDGAVDLLLSGYEATDVAVVGFRQGPHRDANYFEDVTAVGLGDYDARLIARWYDVIAVEPSRLERRGLTIHKLGADALIDVAGQGWLVGAPENASRLVDLAFGEGESVRSDGRLVEIGRRAGLETALLGVAAIVPRELRPTLPFGTVPVLRIAVGIEIDEGTTLRAVVEMENADFARSFASVLGVFVRQLLARPPVAPAFPLPPTFAELLGGVAIAADGAFVTFDAHATEAQTNACLAELAELFAPSFEAMP